VIRKGEPWERPAAGPPEWEVAGDDPALAAAVREHPGARIGFRPGPGSDLARALGVSGPGGATHDLPLDALRIDADGRDLFGVNMVVVGTPPDQLRWWSPRPDLRVAVDGRVVHDGPALGVVVATGQYLRGHDVVPRGHPGDGRLEVQVYAVDRGDRRGVRSRLAQGVHLPHPGITQALGRRIEVVSGRERRVEVDGEALPGARRVAVEVVPGAYLIVV
jgi:hypothetical protein